MKQKRILAIHDISCVGRCSLTVALPILSAAGLDTAVLPTAVLSTHTGGFENFTYRDLTEDVTPISQHWQTLDLKFDAMYSGFLGSFTQIDLVADLFKTFKKENSLTVVDPVMADNGKLYSVYSPEMAKGMAKLCSQADLIIPNLTEAAFLLDEEYKGENLTRGQIESLLKRLAGLGCKQVVLTGVSFESGKLGAAAYDKATDTVFYCQNTRVDGYFHGTGDVFGSALVAALLNSFPLERAVQIAVDYTYECIRLTAQNDMEPRYGVCFERALPYLIRLLHLYLD